MVKQRIAMNFSMAHHSSIAVFVITFLAGSCAYSAALAAESRPPVVTTSFDAERPIASHDRLEFKLDRAIAPSEGRVAVLIGATDVSSLVQRSGSTLIYVPRVVPLPEGVSWVSVYLVSTASAWKQIARFALQVEKAAPSVQQGKPAPVPGASPSAGPHRIWGFDKTAITPSLTVGMKSQPAESNFPAANTPLRPTFADLTLQGAIGSDFVRGPFEAQTQFNIVGSTFQKEALRFAQEGANAPEVDLSSYSIQLRIGKAKLNVGSVFYGSNRELMNSFSSRGFSLSLPLSHGFDLSAAAMNGTSIVGWNNFFGVAQAKHHIVAGTLGFEFLPKRPGGIRLEATVMDGEVLPIANFNQSAVTDAQRNRGFGFHFLASDKQQRWRIDAGFARSNFVNPPDPLLSQGTSVVPVRDVTRNARYLDASYMFVRNRALGKTKKANVTATYHHERVDPLFRSVASFTQADRNQNQLDLVGQFGDITTTVSHQQFNNNLAGIPSILKALTRRTNFIIGLPLSTVFTGFAHPNPWLPRISYSFDETHQFGTALPANGGFELNPSTVPNQVSTNQNLSADWQWKKMRVGYRFNRSFQDNRQVGRELADFKNMVNGINFGITASKALDLSFDLGSESAFNRETVRTDRTLRLGANVNWRLSQKMSLTANVSTTDAGALAGLVKSKSALVNAQWSYQWLHEKPRLRRVRGQFFVRYADQYVFRRDSVFGLNSLTRLQTLNAGLSFTFF
jgi:hypothetical protein